MAGSHQRRHGDGEQVAGTPRDEKAHGPRRGPFARETTAKCGKTRTRQESRMPVGFASCRWNRARAGSGCTRNSRGALGSSPGPRPAPKRVQRRALVVRQPAGPPFDRNGLSAFSGLSARAEPPTAEKGLADPRGAPQPRCDLSGQVKHQSDSNAAFEAVSRLPRAGGITNRIQVIAAGGD
jgi:hypothetical protein